MKNNPYQGATTIVHRSPLSYHPAESTESLRRKAGIPSVWNVSSGDKVDVPEPNFVQSGNFVSKGLDE